jgi:hypothetical protein
MTTDSPIKEKITELEALHSNEKGSDPLRICPIG